MEEDNQTEEESKTIILKPGESMHDFKGSVKKVSNPSKKKAKK